MRSAYRILSELVRLRVENKRLSLLWYPQRGFDTQADADAARAEFERAFPECEARERAAWIDAYDLFDIPVPSVGGRTFP